MPAVAAGRNTLQHPATYGSLTNMPCPDCVPLPWQGSDAEDALQEEEEEVGRMEKEKAARMKAADFGVDDEDEEDGDSEDEEEEEDGEATLGALAKGKVRL